MRTKDALGRHGEQLAVAYLANIGLAILARNWRCREGELDIVAADGEILVFCEVKTRSSTAFGDPAEAVGHAKSARIRRLAVLWLDEVRGAGDSTFWPEVRFDVVSVLCARDAEPRISHVQAAF